MGTARGNVHNVDTLQGLHIRRLLQHDSTVLVAVSQRAPHDHVACVGQRDCERGSTTDLGDVEVIYHKHLSRVVAVHSAAIAELVMCVLTAAIDLA